MIDDIQQQTDAGIRNICRTLGLPRSSYYHAHQPTDTDLADEHIGQLIEEIFMRHRGRYGYRRIYLELQDHDITCAPARVRRIMEQRGLRAIQPKNFTPKTSDGKATKPAPNLLAGEPLPERPNEVWAGDITFIPTASGWIYLAVIIDLCSRRIVGWSLADHMRKELVNDALNNALQSRTIPENLIFHSDRGSQYGSRACREILRNNGMRQSMSARANPYDNAWTESFIGTLKREMLRGGSFINEADARTEIFEYIEAYYNNQRKHSSIGYLTPNQFEAKILTLN
jgi:transposase InsO family protein